MNYSALQLRKPLRPFDYFFFGILIFDLLLIGFSVQSLFEGLSKGIVSAGSKVYASDPAATKKQEAPVVKAEPAVVVEAVKRLTIDNFTKENVNNLGSGRKFLSKYGGIIDEQFLTDKNNNKYVLIDYNVTSAGSEAEYVTGIPDVDLRDFDALVFDFRGASGDEVFRVELEAGKNRKSLSSSEICPETVPTRFRNVVVPLKNFGPAGLRAIKNGRLSIVFSNSLGMPYRGTIALRSVSAQKTQ
jgi:hypothetical protein